jgi:hypothetical protein
MDPRCTIPLRSKCALALVLLASGCRSAPSWIWPPPLGVALLRGNVARDGSGAADPEVVYLVPVGSAESELPLPWFGRSESVVWRSGAFEPRAVAVRVGSDVRIANDGSLAHRLFTAGDGAVQLDLAPHGERTLHAGASGPMHVYCSLHPSEYLLVFASEQRYSRAVAADGSWSLGPVAPGDYRLVLWSPSRERTLRTVRVWPWTVQSHERVDSEREARP